MPEIGTQYTYVCVYTHTHVYVWMSWTCMKYSDILSEIMIRLQLLFFALLFWALQK